MCGALARTEFVEQRYRQSAFGGLAAYIVCSGASNFDRTSKVTLSSGIALMETSFPMREIVNGSVGPNTEARPSPGNTGHGAQSSRITEKPAACTNTCSEGRRSATSNYLNKVRRVPEADGTTLVAEFDHKEGLTPLKPRSPLMQIAGIELGHFD